MAKQLTIEYVSLNKLKPFEGNPRRNDESVDAVVKSIEAFGYTNPILARRANNEIIAGHTRLKALKKLGAKKAPVIYLDLDETDARVYSVFDNKSVELADWDFPKLADLLVEFDQLNVDLDLTGFNDDEIDKIAPETFEHKEAEEEKILPEGLEYMSFVVTSEQREEIQNKLNEQEGENPTEQLLCLIRK
jgi:ParB family chromosome partitioning protein